MQHSARFALLVASALLGWASPPVSALRAVNTSRSLGAYERPGTESIRVAVGCGSSVSYPTHAPTRDPTKPRFSYVIAHPVAEFISLHFSQFRLPADDYIIVRSTASSDAVQSLQYFGRDYADKPVFFTKALYTKSVTVELFSNGSASSSSAIASQRPCVGFAIDQFRFLAESASFDGSAQEAVCGPDDSGEAACFKAFPDAFDKSNAVARLLIHKDGSSFFCTGWLVGCEGHMLTNHHCISNSDHAANTEFEFLGQGNACADQCNKPFGCEGKTRAVTSRLVIASAEFDYALIKLEGKLWKDYGYLQMREGGPALDERIYIPQHPAGWGKRIAMKDGDQYGTVTALDQGGCLPDQVAYNLDTQGGSSGSPVLSWKDNAVVALHHCGGCPNTAVNIDKIIKDLRAKDLLPKCAIYEQEDKPHDKSKRKALHQIEP
jgi:V8-like Glu-specific endopeptidase